MSIGESKFPDLEKYLGKEIVITIEDDWDAFHGDDTDHFHSGPIEITGKLHRIHKDGIVLTGCIHAGYLREYWKHGVECTEPEIHGESYFSFDYHSVTPLSRTDRQIVSINLKETIESYEK